jgi:HAD superfamily hydrolase (TIGR01509 family)
MAFEAVLFDCDGVLVDSEQITNTVIREMLAELGWQLTLAECTRRFVGKTLADEAQLIEAHTGVAITEAWLAEFRGRRNRVLAQELQPVRHAADAVRAAHAAHGGRIACASGADRGKIELQLAKVGLLAYFEGRIFSGQELPRSKPAPDVYLAAAAALGVDPRRCAVIEDSVSGALAGVAAGATVFGYSPGDLGHSTPDELRAAGVVDVFDDMARLPALLRGGGPSGT